MTPAPELISRLKGTTAAGTESETTAACTVRGAIRRELGLNGDALLCQVRALDDAGEVNWPPDDWDLSKEIALEFGLEGATITLGGYLLMDAEASMGVSEPDHSTTGAIVVTAYELSLMTWPGVLRNGRGGRITAGTLNPVDSKGAVKTGDDDYKTNSELVEIAIAAMGAGVGDVPETIDDFDAPGPLDWGNAPALAELEAVLARVGYIAVLSLDGTEISVVRLPIAGETMTLPDEETDHAEPYTLADHRSVRGTTIVVSSGRTRSIIISEHSLADMAWVAYDERSMAWGHAGQWEDVYPDEIGPEDIAAYRAGPPRDARGRRQWSRLFGAVGLSDGAVRKRKRMMIPLPIQVDDAEDGVSKGAAWVKGRGLIARGANQLANDPPEASAIKRFEGAKVHSPDGVIELPTGVEWCKFEGADVGTREHAVPLEGDDLVIRFAHEAHEDDRLLNYYWAVYTAEIVEGELTLTEVVDEEAIEAAIDDRDSLHIEMPFLVRVLDWPIGETDPIEVAANRTALDAIALKLAKVRAAGAIAQGGVVDLRGLQERTPGDFGGAASAITWDIVSLMTRVSINAHEAPQAWMDVMEADANRSLAAGLGRFSPPASSAAMSEVRGGSTPGDGHVAGLSGGSGGGFSAATAAATRGAEDRVSGQAPITLPVADLRMQPEQALWARITGAEIVGDAGDNQWKYEWETIAWADAPLTVSVAGTPRTHATDGYAYNSIELPNDGAGVEGNAVDRDNLPEAFAMQPIAAGVAVRLHGPFGTDEAPYWVFSAVNSDDGECEEEEVEE